MHAVESPKRFKVILDYIVENERAYSGAMIAFNKKVAESKSAKTRAFSRILAYFLKKQLIDRTYENELSVIQNNIDCVLAVPESARHKEIVDQNERRIRLSKQM